MLTLDVKRVFALRGVANPFAHLRKIGISSATAWNLLDKRVKSISTKHLELICTYLNCEPNDLYEWKPDKGTVNAETHALKRLRRDGKASSYSELIRAVPLNKISEVETALANLGNDDPDA